MAQNALEGIVSKSTLLCGDGMVCVHCHFDYNPLSDCSRDCNLGICHQKLGVTWFTWVTVAMSTHSGDRHRFGSLWVAFFGFWGDGCKRVGIRGSHNALPRVATICGWLGTRLGWLGTHVGCHWRPLGTIILVFFPLSL